MIKIIKPGLLTSIQDLGRTGFQKYGVIASGSMDLFAHRIANILVGNEENAPTLEITLLGPEIDMEEDALISICGGDLSPTVNDIPIQNWRTTLVKKGSKLKFGPIRNGCRSYLAVAGGFRIQPVMNSTSTYLRANIGGFKGRKLQANDQIPILTPSKLATQMLNDLQAYIGNHSLLQAKWTIANNLFPYKSKNMIRVMEGRNYHLFEKQSQTNFFRQAYKITRDTDRMGYRLQGPTLRLLNNTYEMISEAVAFGTIQVTKDGNPIILMADRQTTGGYPKIGEIATVDLPVVAQAKPNELLYFKKVSLPEAQSLYIKNEEKIIQLKHGIANKYT